MFDFGEVKLRIIIQLIKIIVEFFLNTLVYLIIIFGQAKFKFKNVSISVYEL